MAVIWPFRENGAEIIHTALVKVGLLQFKMCFKIMYRSKWAVSSNNWTEVIDALQNEKVKNNELIK